MWVWGVKLDHYSDMGSGVRKSGVEEDKSASADNPRMCVFVKGHEKQAVKRYK